MLNYIKKYKSVFLYPWMAVLLLISLSFSQSGDDIFKDLEKRKKTAKTIVTKKYDEKIENGWNPRLATRILLTQSSYSNWTRGGENSLAWALNLDGLLLYKKDKLFWTNELKTAFGQSQLGSQGIRKTNDRFQMESTLSLHLRKYLTPFVSGLVQTQLAPGYKYTKISGTDDEIRIKISGFWDPAFLYQSAGLSVLPVKGFGVRLGLAAREIFTRKFHEYSDNRWYSVNSGMELVADLNRRLLDRTRVKSNLRMFSSFDNFLRVNMVWESELLLEFNRLFSANLKVNLYYEPDITLKMQIHEILGIGIRYDFFN